MNRARKELHNKVSDKEKSAMKKHISVVILAMVLVVAMLFGTACGGSGVVDADGNVSLKVGTGGPTGTYFAYTNAVGTALKGATGYSFDVLSTGGSVANINGIADGDYTMAIVQNDTMLKAYNDLDKENFKTGAIKDFAVIGQVYSEVVQIVVRGDLKDKVKSLADLKGMRVSVGDAGSGVYNNAKTLFEAYGMTLKDIQENNLSVGDSANAMKDDQLDAFFFTAGVPTTAITELATSMDVFMLSLGDDVIANFIANNKLDGKYEVYSKQPITNEHYSFIPKDEPAYTIGVTATFIMSNEVSEEIAYNVTKALWENKDQIAKGHVVGTSMNRDNAVLTIGNVPVHPGALKYYKEVGVIK